MKYAYFDEITFEVIQFFDSEQQSFVLPNEKFLLELDDKQWLLKDKKCWVVDGVLIDTLRPNADHDWNAKKKAWVENTIKVAAIAAAAAAALIPKVVSMEQAQLSLLDAGYLDDIEGYMNSDAASREAKIYWSKSTVVRRDDATVALMQGLLKLSDSDIDTLFVLAAKK